MLQYTAESMAIDYRVTNINHDWTWGYELGHHPKMRGYVSARTDIWEDLQFLVDTDDQDKKLWCAVVREKKSSM